MITIKLLFWNLARNSIEKYIADIINENDIDICVFAEYNSINFEIVLSGLNNSYTLFDGMGGCDKITLIARSGYDVEIRREQNRYTIYSVYDNTEKYIITGIHLQDRLNADAETRKNTIRKIVQDIKEQENKLKHDNTIVIGDFNASPFDEELVQKDAFSEDDSTYGSHYYDSGIKSIYWYFLDQVIIRKSLVDRLSDIRIIKVINNQKLIKAVKPNSDISDHLPLIVEFERRVIND